MILAQANIEKNTDFEGLEVPCRFCAVHGIHATLQEKRMARMTLWNGGIWCYSRFRRVAVERSGSRR